MLITCDDDATLFWAIANKYLSWLSIFPQNSILSQYPFIAISCKLGQYHTCRCLITMSSAVMILFLWIVILLYPLRIQIYWHVMGDSAAEAEIFQNNYINTMAADPLAPCTTRSSAPMVLNMQDKWFLVFNNLCLEKKIYIYCQIFNIKRTWVGNEIVDHSDVCTSSFSTEHLASIYRAKTNAGRVEKH